MFSVSPPPKMHFGIKFKARLPSLSWQAHIILSYHPLQTHLTYCKMQGIMSASWSKEGYWYLEKEERIAAALDSLIFAPNTAGGAGMEAARLTPEGRPGPPPPCQVRPHVSPRSSLWSLACPHSGRECRSTNDLGWGWGWGDIRSGCQAAEGQVVVPSEGQGLIKQGQPYWEVAVVSWVPINVLLWYILLHKAILCMFIEKYNIQQHRGNMQRAPVFATRKYKKA